MGCKKTVISDHIRGGIRQSANHVYELSKFSDYHDIPSVSSVLSRFLFSPIRGIDIALKKACPQALVVYPYWRFMWMKAAMNMIAKQKQKKKCLKLPSTSTRK